MTIVEEFQAISKSGIFWTALVLSLLGVAFAIFLLYKGKDKIASLLISIPMGILAMLIINLLTMQLFIDVNPDWVDYAIRPGMSILSFSTIVWFCRKFLVTLVAKLFGFKITK